MLPLQLLKSVTANIRPGDSFKAIHLIHGTPFMALLDERSNIMELLCVMTVLNIIMLLLNVWMRIDSEKTLAELKKRTGDSEDENETS